MKVLLSLLTSFCMLLGLSALGVEADMHVAAGHRVDRGQSTIAGSDAEPVLLAAADRQSGEDLVLNDAADLDAAPAELGVEQDRKRGFFSRLFHRDSAKDSTTDPVAEMTPEEPMAEEPTEPGEGSEDASALGDVENIRRIMPSQLDLNEALTIALTNNVQLALSIMDLMAAHEDVQSMKSYMEPDLVIDASMEEGRRKNTVEQSVSLLTDEFEEENSLFGAALEGILPFGTTYRVGYDMDELSNSLSNRTFRAPFDSQYVGFLGISVTQPLLRNFGLSFTRSNLTNARLQEGIAEQNLRKQRMLTVANTALAYWEVWMQQELVKIRQNSMENARTLQKANEQRQEEGKMAAIEVEAARVGVVKREADWLDAHTQYHEAVNALANLLALDLDGEDVVLDSEEITLLSDQELQVEKHLENMWGRHPDVQIRDMEIEVGELQLMVLKNQRRPELNMVGSYGHNGLGADLSESHEDIADGDYDRWSLGLIFRVGLGGGQDMIHRTRKAKINLERTELARRYVQKEIENRLRTTLRKVALLRDSLNHQEEAVAINERALESEKKLLDAGKSKTARLLEVEEDLLAVREDLVRIQTLYRRGLVEMRIANARILEAFGLE